LALSGWITTTTRPSRGDYRLPHPRRRIRQVMLHRGSEASMAVSDLWHSYVLRRIGKSLITLYLVISLSFFLLRYMPGDPIQAYVQNLMVTQGLSYNDARAQATSLLSFSPSDPIYTQYLHYVGSLLHGDMGQSIASPGTAVSGAVFTYLPWTLFSAGLGTLIAFALGVVLGIVTAYRRGGVLDHLVTNISSLVHAVPNYILAMLILVVLGVRFQLFDITNMRGTLTPGVQVGFTPEFFGDVLYHAGLPILVTRTSSRWREPVGCAVGESGCSSSAAMRFCRCSRSSRWPSALQWADRSSSSSCSSTAGPASICSTH
jgi:hypothetical protein